MKYNITTLNELKFFYAGIEGFILVVCLPVLTSKFG